MQILRNNKKTPSKLRTANKIVLKKSDVIQMAAKTNISIIGSSKSLSKHVLNPTQVTSVQSNLIGSSKPQNEMKIQDSVSLERVRSSTDKMQSKEVIRSMTSQAKQRSRTPNKAQKTAPRLNSSQERSYAAVPLVDKT